jgi:GNAT superfamily N-acetyltransferase
MGAAAVTIRPALEADAPVIARLLAEGTLRPGEEDPQNPRPYAEAVRRIRAAGGEVLVAVDDGDVVGVLEVVVLEHLQHQGGRAAELESVHVDERRRSQGIGAALVAAAVAWARQQGCYRVQLTSNRVRTDAHRFYELNGFTASHVGFKRAID